MDKLKEKRKHPLNDPQARLMLAIRFTEEDLQANREGYMTKNQRGQVGDDRVLWKIFFALTIILLLIGMVWVVLDSVYFKDSLTSRAGTIGLLWMVAFAIEVYIWRKVKKFDLDLHKGDVQAVQGMASIGERLFSSRGPQRYYVSIQNLSWNIDLMAYSSFVNGDPYAIYFAPHSKTLLSAEWLGKREVSE